MACVRDNSDGVGVYENGHDIGDENVVRIYLMVVVVMKMVMILVRMMRIYLMVNMMMKMVMTLMRIYLMVVTPPVLTLMAPSSHILVDLQIFKVFLQLAYIQCCRKSKGVKKVSYSVRLAKYGGLVELTE